MQERSNLQAKDLQEAQNQRKLAVQEFTDVNEKVNELRSKNNKFSTELLNKEDEIDDLKRSSNELRTDLEKRDRQLDDLRLQIAALNDTIKELENEKQILNESSRIVADQAPPVVVVEPAVDESLVELNAQLNKEIRQLQAQMEASSLEVEELRLANGQLQVDIQGIKDKSAANQREQHAQMQEQLAELTGAKEKEISFLQAEMKKLLEENEKVIKRSVVKMILKTLC